ncbi:DUF4405 domain-containing protein [Candidatus Chloroploca sp. Khr17]|uniref:DUF4405 domain-containing protein n=1 Tax=Candidatus Chloroploca sp. Khr17 TaxID=2496869 RepID=UPI00101D23F9|nr:DUF4405 domain-containing protein [Candidatus Chloroploca sp. Khr17]
MEAKRTPVRRTTINLLIDGAMFLAFLVATAPHLSGLAIHEWLSLALGVALITHLLLHWNWIVQVARRFFGKASWTARLNYLLNSLLFIAFSTIIVTGIMISEVALPFIGISFARDAFWLGLHRMASDATIVILGLHIALHWNWLVNTTRRLFARSTRKAGTSVATQPVVAASRSQERTS